MPKKGQPGKANKPTLPVQREWANSIYGSTMNDGQTIQKVPTAQPPKSSWWAEAKDRAEFVRLAAEREGHFRSTRSRDSIPRSDW